MSSLYSAFPNKKIPQNKEKHEKTFLLPQVENRERQCLYTPAQDNVYFRIPFLSKKETVCRRKRVGDVVPDVVVYLKFTLTWGTSLLIPSLLVNCTISSLAKVPRTVL